jgi:serine/threonine-protein kinase
VEPVSYSQQLDLAQGQVSRTGTLKSNETLNFVVPARQEQRLTASLRSEGVLLSVLAPNQDPVDDTANRVSGWNGTLPFTGNYTIQLKTVKGLSKSDFRLNVTLADPPSPSPSPSPTSSPTEPTIDASTVTIPPGQTSVQITGNVNPQVIRRYVINARQGQILTLGVTGARLTVRYPDGRPVEDASNLPGWQGTLPRSGDYQIDVIADQPTNFTLDINVR